MGIRKHAKEKQDSELKEKVKGLKAKAREDKPKEDKSKRDKDNADRLLLGKINSLKTKGKNVMTGLTIVG